MKILGYDIDYQKMQMDIEDSQIYIWILKSVTFDIGYQKLHMRIEELHIDIGWFNIFPCFTKATYGH